MNECQSVPESDAFRQGDIFLSHPRGDGQVDQLHVIITADCDIAQKKAGPSFTWLPIVPAIGFVEHFWMQEKVAKLEGRLREHLALLVNRLHHLLNPAAIDLGETFVADWAASDRGEAIIGSLRPTPAEQEQLIKYVDALQSLASADLVGSPFKQIVDLFYEVQHQTGLIQDAPKAKSRFSDVRSILTEPRQDAFFVSGIPGKDTSGWVIKLRDIDNIPVSYLSSTRSEWYTSDKNHLRIGRFSSVYKYAISQQFGSLFSRIGLPSDYGQWRSLVIDDVCGNLYPMGA